MCIFYGHGNTNFNTAKQNNPSNYKVMREIKLCKVVVVCKGRSTFKGHWFLESARSDYVCISKQFIVLYICVGSIVDTFLHCLQGVIKITSHFMKFEL